MMLIVQQFGVEAPVPGRRGETHSAAGDGGHYNALLLGLAAHYATTLSMSFCRLSKLKLG